MKKYESLAADLEALIASGTIQPGERLPSVRQTIAARHLSPSTVFEAYYLLGHEDWSRRDNARATS